MKNDQLTPAMRRQLRALAERRGDVNLATVKTLIARGLVLDNANTRHNLRIHCRLPGAYPLTGDGKTLARELDDERPPPRPAGRHPPPRRGTARPGERHRSASTPPPQRLRERGRAVRKRSGPRQA